MSPTRSRPPRRSLPAGPVQEFRELLDQALDAADEHGRRWSDAQWGCYAFYDYDDEPIYVGQTNERLRTRIRRHLTNQRSDAVAMRILDVFEVAEMELWPLWDYEGTSPRNQDAKRFLNQLEYTIYTRAVFDSRFQAILNEKIPPRSPVLAELPPSKRFRLIGEQSRAEREHPDVRIARRAEAASRLASVAHERGEVSPGLRRALVVQAVRLAYLAACRLAYVEGRDEPDAQAINITGLIGQVDEPFGPADVDGPQEDDDVLPLGFQRDD